MPRKLNLRQIEAFKAVIENGTVSRGAELLNISQPALSKLIAHLEQDSGLKLFDRVKGRLAPTEHAMRLHDEVGRIFAGVRQVENAIETIRREEQGRLAVGVMPALGGSFIQHAISGFLKRHENTFCSVQSLGSQWIVEWVIARKLDVGLVGAAIANPYVTLEPLLQHPLVCVMPRDHPLAAKSRITPDDLDKRRFVNFHQDTYVGHRINTMFEDYKVQPQIVLVSNAMQTIFEFVAAGLGISLVHPLMVSGGEDRVVLRHFEPEITDNFFLCRSADSRNAYLVEEFVQEIRKTAAEISAGIIL